MREARTVRTRATVICAILVFAGGGVVAANWSHSALADPVEGSSAAPVQPQAKVNARGLTYGSSADDDPDLVLVQGAAGVKGYVYAKDLEDPIPSSPREALEQQEKAKFGRDIPVYDLEGVAVVDRFHVGGIAETVEGPAR